jgi:hypothetical protein
MRAAAITGVARALVRSFANFFLRARVSTIIGSATFRIVIVATSFFHVSALT